MTLYSIPGIEYYFSSRANLGHFEERVDDDCGAPSGAFDGVASMGAQQIVGEGSAGAQARGKAID